MSTFISKEIMEAEYKSVFFYILSLCNDAHEAEEITQ